MSRTTEQANVMFLLGQLFGPLLQLSDNPGGVDRADRLRLYARFAAEESRFLEAVKAFSAGEPGHNYEPIRARVHIQVIRLRQALFGPTEDELPSLIRKAVAEIREDILSIPTPPVESAVYEAHTSFSTYCLLNDLCATVRTRLVWMDRYFDHTLFHRFFTNTSKEACITLVTWPSTKATTPSDRRRVTEFMDISRMFAAERGAAGYQLFVNDDFHSRWLQCDDKLFLIGESIKELSRASLSVARLDSTPENFRQFDDAIAKGVEVFGPHSTHP